MFGVYSCLMLGGCSPFFISICHCKKKLPSVFFFFSSSPLYSITASPRRLLYEPPTVVDVLVLLDIVAYISKKEHSLPCLTGFLPCRCLATSIVSTFKVIKGINFCKTYQNL